jgi:formylmethanofuran dehydrogenase subunit B
MACPFCSLVCDDVGVHADGRGCAKAARGFGRASVTEGARHSIRGQPATLGEAAAAAARLLLGARLPLVTGLGVDVEGMRALLAVADRVGGVVDRWDSATQLSTLAVIQANGAMTASFGEIANRADVMVIVGADPTPSYPRFFERLVHHRPALHRTEPPFVAFLGRAEAAPTDPAVAEHLLIDEPRSVVETLAALSALFTRRKGRAVGAAGLPARALGHLAERLAASRYGAIVWDPQSFAAAEVELVASLLLVILRRLNAKTRCVGLALASGDNAPGVAQAMLWQTGWPGRVSFASGAPEHDPWLYDAGRLVAAQEVDALVWVAALTPAPPPACAVPTIALVAADIALPSEPAVTIRVGVPGIDHAGTVVRADTVIAVPLAATRPSALPSVARAADIILGALQAAAA